MRLKKLAVVFGFVLCFTLVFFTSQRSAQAQNPLEGLNTKLAEMRDVLKMNIALTEPTLAKNRIQGFLLQLIKSDTPNFAFFEATSSGVGSQISNTQYDLMANNLYSSQGYDLKFDVIEINYEKLKEESQADEHEAISRVLVTVEFFWTTPTEFRGKMVFRIYHMKRCIWD